MVTKNSLKFISILHSSSKKVVVYVLTIILELIEYQNVSTFQLNPVNVLVLSYTLYYVLFVFL